MTAQLSSGGYVFPVYGPASFGDTFGAPRADVSGGWHHGEDIFAPLGTPLLAVADGIIFSVGWNDIGGWRVWLRDRSGNEFYYAHLSAYSPLAVNGRQVQAGDVLGFMGKTGDAEFSPAHLHFEIHPVSLLARGYDGAVAPYPFLMPGGGPRTSRSISAGRTCPLDGPAGRAGVAPPAGAVLLEADDISERERARAGRPRGDARRPGSEELDRRSLAAASSYFFFSSASTSTASAAASAAPFAVADAPFSNSSVDGDVETVQRLQVVVARDLVHQPGARLRAGPGVVERACDQAREKHGVALLVALFFLPFSESAALPKSSSALRRFSCTFASVARREADFTAPSPLLTFFASGP